MCGVCEIFLTTIINFYMYLYIVVLQLEARNSIVNILEITLTCTCNSITSSLVFFQVMGSISVYSGWWNSYNRVYFNDKSIRTGRKCCARKNVHTYMNDGLQTSALIIFSIIFQISTNIIIFICVGEYGIRKKEYWRVLQKFFQLLVNSFVLFDWYIPLIKSAYFYSS